MPRTYAITGSASGIGLATRGYLEARGARVIGVDLHGAEVIADLSAPEGRTARVDAVDRTAHGVLDGVIACAGVFMTEPLTVRVNYFGAVATLEGLRPLLARGDEPRAVGISSVASIHPVEDAVVEACLAGDEEGAAAAAEGKGELIYTSSKAALARWVRRTAPTEPWAGAGIPLNAIAPGVILTPMAEPLVANEQMRPVLEATVPMPLGGYAAPERVAALLAWLAGPENTTVTGQVVFIDGGADAILRGDSVW
jgi:NAD(P)-dependent dehydrogenase (short-subunit alcohol dehydrogenase family)